VSPLRGWSPKFTGNPRLRGCCPTNPVEGIAPKVLSLRERTGAKRQVRAGWPSSGPSGHLLPGGEEPASRSRPLGNSPDRRGLSCFARFARWLITRCYEPRPLTWVSGKCSESPCKGTHWVVLNSKHSFSFGGDSWPQITPIQGFNLSNLCDPRPRIRNFRECFRRPVRTSQSRCACSNGRCGPT
jgi:hypothetical protein